MQRAVHPETSQEVEQDGTSTYISHHLTSLCHSNVSVDHASNDWTDDVSKLHDRLDHEDGLDEEVQVGGLRKSGAQKLVLCARQNLFERRHGE